MRRAMPWSGLTSLIEPHYPTVKAGRPPFPRSTMVQIHLVPQWFGLSDPALEEAVYGAAQYRRF
ncbi:hypothetical protein OKW43_005875 [Paraburkholderia sp. WC7.3g]|uniref:Transposase n=1 Tax=Paraburkholderia podalyriae TaxID=1938811 RepID=A0ABR7PVD8_9BURK|nr:transposase [Paraburkholderia podalyriae]